MPRSYSKYIHLFETQPQIKKYWMELVSDLMYLPSEITWCIAGYLIHSDITYFINIVHTIKVNYCPAILFSQEYISSLIHLRNAMIDYVLHVILGKTKKKREAIVEAVVENVLT